MPEISVKCRSCRYYRTDGCIGEKYACSFYESHYYISDEEKESWPTYDDMRRQIYGDSRGIHKREPKEKTVKIEPFETLFYADKKTGKIKTVIVYSVDKKTKTMIVLFRYTNKYAKVPISFVGTRLFKRRKDVK